MWLTLLLTATPVQWALIELGRAPDVTPAQLHLFTVLSWGLLALDALLGMMILRARWRRATTQDRPRAPAPLPLVTVALLVAALVLAGCSTSSASTADSSQLQVGDVALGHRQPAGAAVQGDRPGHPGRRAGRAASRADGHGGGRSPRRAGRTVRVTLGQFPG